MLRIAKTPPQTPTAWTRQELNRLFTAAAEYEGEIFEIPISVYFTALLHLLFDTGERIGSLVQVRWSDVDLSGGWVTFRAATRKGRGAHGDNVQKLSRKTVRALQTLRHAAERPNANTQYGSIHVRVKDWQNTERNPNQVLSYANPILHEQRRASSRTEDFFETAPMAAELEQRQDEGRRNKSHRDTAADAYVFPRVPIGPTCVAVVPLHAQDTRSGQPTFRQPVDVPSN